MERLSLYEIDNYIDALLRNAVDEETGEISEEVIEALEKYEIAKADKVEAIALYIKNLSVLAAGLKAEKMAIADRQQKTENKIERLKKMLQESLDGEKMQSAKYSISYRTSTKCIVDDESCIAWLRANNHDECVKVEESVRLTEVKNLLAAGEDVDGAYLEKCVNMTIK